jgi:hypothetical protein
MFAALMKSMKLQTLKKGELLYDLGDSADFTYFLLQGELHMPSKLQQSFKSNKCVVVRQNYLIGYTNLSGEIRDHFAESSS